LSSLKSDFFTTRTRLEELDLGFNLVSYLYPNSFVIHRRLRSVDLQSNKMSYFPAEILNSIRSLQTINLSSNKLQSLEQSDFANMQRLRELDLSRNEITFVSGTAFANSTNFIQLNSNDNRISSHEEVTFKGIARLQLKLANNRLANGLLSDISNCRHVFQLERVDLSHNQLKHFPGDSLRKLNLSFNTIQYDRSSLK
jgi:Leucine-rich repeat (LRR) protein